MEFNLEKIAIVAIATVALIFVLKFFKGCIKAVIMLFIIVAAAVMLYKAGGVEAVTSSMVGYVGEYSNSTGIDY